MSTYYKQEFTSPDPLFAEVKEELSSYFASGAIDDVMFPKWTEDCLKRFRKSAFKIEQIVLRVKDFKACLPDGFEGVREAWACNEFVSPLYQSATAQYYQQDCRIDPVSTDGCGPCADGANSCTTDYNVVHKVTGVYQFSFKRTYLLTPGTIRARNRCEETCINLGASSPYSFDVENGNLLTNFNEGIVHLVYYSDPSLEGDQMIPDNWWIQDFIRKYIIFKCFSKLSNIITDESFNQIVHKKAEAKQEQEIAFIVAETELKKQTTHDKLRQIRKSYERFNKYRLPGDNSYNH
jgi:hypothetical protein